MSSITIRNDKFKEKTAEVNDNLVRFFTESNTYFIKHGNNVSPHHLKRSRLHLNRKGKVFYLVISLKLCLIFLIDLLNQGTRILF